MVPARAVPGRLDFEAIIAPIHDDLRLALWLHITAHHAEAHVRPAVANGEARNDGLERTLARRIDIGVSINKAE